MKAFIVEDELIARKNLVRALEENCPDVEVIGTAGSVREAVAWLQGGKADIIFMDVELSDGKCFEIFRQVEVKAKVIMTTAYENYAVKAFEVNSIDYLLKPIDPSALVRAVSRCRESRSVFDVDLLMRALGTRQGDVREEAESKSWRERFLVQLGDRIVPVKTADILCFFSQDGNNYVMTTDSAVYIIDLTLDSVMSELDPSRFFRISRGGIVSKEAVGSVSKLLGGRLRLTLACTVHNSYSPDLTVSRSRSDDFLSWLDS